MAVRSMMVAAALLLCIGSAYGADRCHCRRCGEVRGELGTKTADAFTGTAQSALKGTAAVAGTSVSDTAATPLTAVQAVKDTAGTALEKTDAALKVFTGEEG